MALRFPDPVPQYLSASGSILPFGKLSLFTSGTNDLIDVFADINGGTPIDNPVILGADGRLPNVFFNGSAKAILTDANDVQIWERDPVGGAQATSALIVSESDASPAAPGTGSSVGAIESGPRPPVR